MSAHQNFLMIPSQQQQQQQQHPVVVAGANSDSSAQQQVRDTTAPPAASHQLSMGVEADMRAKDALTNFSDAVIHAQRLLRQEEQRLKEAKLVLETKDKQLRLVEENLSKQQELLAEAEARRARLQQQYDLRRGDLGVSQQQLSGLQQPRKDVEQRAAATTAAVQQVQSDYTDQSLSIQEEILRQLEGDNCEELERILKEKEDRLQKTQARVAAKKKELAGLKERHRLYELEQQKKEASSLSESEDHNSVQNPTAATGGADEPAPLSALALEIQKKQEQIHKKQQRVNALVQQTAEMEKVKGQEVLELEAQLHEREQGMKALLQRKESVNEELLRQEEIYRRNVEILQHRTCGICHSQIEVPLPHSNPNEDLVEGASQSSQIAMVSQTSQGGAGLASPASGGEQQQQQSYQVAFQAPSAEEPGNNDTTMPSTE